MKIHDIHSEIHHDIESCSTDNEMTGSKDIRNISNIMDLNEEYDKIDEYLDKLWEDILVPCIEKGCILQDITHRDRYKFFNYMKKNSWAIKEINRLYDTYAKKALDTSNSMYG